MARFRMLDTAIGKIRMVSTEEGNAADIVVCMAWTNPPLLPDNVAAMCSRCGCKLQHRPHCPSKPPKVCAACALTWTKPH